MNESKKGFIKKIEQSHGVRIGIALVFTIVLVWVFLPEQKEQDELAHLAKRGDWQKLIDTSEDYLQKEQSPKAFYYKAQGHFQLFKNSKDRKKEAEELTNALTVIKNSLDLFPNSFQTEYQFAMRPIIKGAEHYFHYVKLKGDTAIANKVAQMSQGLFEVYQQTEVEKIQSDIVKQAYGLLGTKYAAGGTNPNTGFDCSGFTRYIFKQQGMILPHGAFLQINSGVVIDKKDAKEADLIFFVEDTTVSHVGIVVGRNANGLVMVHAASEGVMETDEVSGEWKNYWSKKQMTIKRLLVE